MIPVKPAPEPADFDAKVRRKGLAAIAELVGESPKLVRRGRRRKAIAARREHLPASSFPPFWSDALDDLLLAYERRCAYLAADLGPATGNASVDHLVAKSRAWDQVYEWKNYRLCAGLINAKKGDRTAPLDPFEIGEGWFGLELVGFQVVRGPRAPRAKLGAIDETISTLGLNLRDCCQLRERYVTDYQQGDISLHYLTKRAPFVALELRRQGALLARDLTPPARR